MYVLSTNCFLCGTWCCAGFLNLVMFRALCHLAASVLIVRSAMVENNVLKPRTGCNVSRDRLYWFSLRNLAGSRGWVVVLVIKAIHSAVECSKVCHNSGGLRLFAALTMAKHPKQSKSWLLSPLAVTPKCIALMLQFGAPLLLKLDWNHSVKMLYCLTRPAFQT